MVFFFRSKVRGLAAARRNSPRRKTRTQLTHLRDDGTAWFAVQKPRQMPIRLRGCGAQPPGGGIGPLEPITLQRCTARDASRRARSESIATGDVAHGKAFGPVSAFVVIGMTPPSTARAMVLTFLNTAFFKPRSFAPPTDHIRRHEPSQFRSCKLFENESCAYPGRRLTVLIPMSSRATLVLRTLGDPRDS